MKRLLKMSALAFSAATFMVCWHVWHQPALAQNHPVNSTMSIPSAIAQCIPARTGGVMRFQSSTTLDNVNYYLYYVADTESDGGYDVLIEQSGTTCHRLIGSENERIYTLSHYIPFRAAYQLWVGVFKHRIDEAGGVTQYQKKLEGDEAAFCPCFISEEEAKARESLGLKTGSNYSPYPADGFPAN